ncbi:MAG: hypothetical protein ACRDP7_35020 [Trebonia sp.]
MQAPYCQQRLLRRTERTLRRSDPQLAAMLAIFAQLYASEVLTSPEQHARVQRMTWLLGSVTCVAASLSACAGALSRVARATWRVARCGLGAAQHSGATA